MASKNSTNNTSPASGRRPTAERTNGDSIRWIGGLLLLFAGLFAVASVLFSFVSWDVDQSILQKPAEERELLGNEVENLCGETGARLGRLLVDDSFGVFGILIPVVVAVMVALVGLRIIRQRPLLVNHSLLSLFLILILGSLTLGFAFGDNWSICCSTGWGGAFGIEVAAVLHARIGGFGTLILLLGGWILTGVFINRNFVKASNVLVIISSEEDLFLLDYTRTLLKTTHGSVAIVNKASTTTPGYDKIIEAIEEFTATVPQANLLPEKDLTPGLFNGYNFMLISYDTWNDVSEHRKEALQRMPSTLILNKNHVGTRNMGV